MQLIDFEQFQPLNDARKKMSQTKLGNFRLIDPKKHLTYLQTEALRANNFAIKLSDVRVLSDKTLAYKNNRLWLKLIKNPQTGIVVNEFHLANCEQVQKFRHHKYEVVAGSEMLVAGRVCGECLMELKYQGLDARRGRRQGFMESVVESFNLSEFKQEYDFLLHDE